MSSPDISNTHADAVLQPLMDHALANAHPRNRWPRIRLAPTLMRNSQHAVTKLFARAGVAFDGRNAWDIRVHNDRLFSRILSHGSLGLGEAYMDGDWDCLALDELFDRLIRAR